MELGDKLRRMRLQKGLTQEELADRCELSKGFISLLERDLTSPSIATLSVILECLGSGLRAFFNEREDQKVVFRAQDMSVKEEDDELRGSITWLVPGAQGNAMEPIEVSIGPGGQTPREDPHEGEEFGLVLAGAVTVVMGDRRLRARKDESFYFRPSAPHYIMNTGKTRARVVWVVTPPSF